MGPALHPVAMHDPALPAAKYLIRLIAKLAATASIEASRDLDGLRTMPMLPGTTIAVPWRPGDTEDDRVAAARTVRTAGFDPLPHIVARELADAATADRLLRRLRDEASVSQLLVIGGDAVQPRGELGSALELLARSRPARLGYCRIGFGGYPETHAAIAEAVLDAGLDTKIAVAQDAGLEPFVVTQLAFAAAPIFDWLQRFRSRHDDTPVRIGLAGPASIHTLLRHGRMRGVGGSSRALLNNGASIARLLVDATPAPVLRAFAAGGMADRHATTTLHFFAFGGLERTARWLAQVAEGQIQLHTSESGFTVGDRS